MVNNVVLVGRLTFDPKDNVKTTANGHKYIWNVIAVDNTYRKHTNFINIKLWKQQADFAERFLNKGQLVSVVGELNIVEYNDKKHTEIDVKEIKSLENPNKQVEQLETVKPEQQKQENDNTDIPWDIEL